jgi:Fe-S oxidoreductase
MIMWDEFLYSATTYPLLYFVWGMVALSWLAAGAGLIVRLLRARPVARADRPLRRFLAMLSDALLQRPIWRLRLGGLMHASLFWGGILILVFFVLTHYVAPRGLAWRRSGDIRLLGDLGLTLLLVGLALAGWRRWGPSRATRGQSSLPARDEDVALWALLTVTVMALWLVNALTIVVSQPIWRSRAFLSALLARPLQSLPETTARSLYGWTWALLHSAILGVALLLPWSKWRHMLLSPASLFTRKSRSDRPPLARMDDLDLEREPPFGAQTPRELTWKERLDLAACTHCGRCSAVCPATRAGHALDPRALLERLADARNGSSPPLAQQAGEAVLWQCTTCMACDDICPVGISPLSLVLDLRRERVLDAAAFPLPLQQVFVNLQRRGDPWGLGYNGAGSTARDVWTASLGVPILERGERAELLLWLGCMGGHEERARRAVEAFVALLRQAQVPVAVLGADEGCCGDVARRAGNEHLWQELAAANREALQARDVGRIVTLCPHCANTLGHEYKGLAIPVVHATALLAELLDAGRLPPLRTPDHADRRITYHDPCYLGRGTGEYRAARKLLAALPGVEVVELEWHGRDATCCGAGGGQMWLEQPGPPLSSLRLAEIDALSAAGRNDVICATACPYCATMLGDAAPPSRRSNGITGRQDVAGPSGGGPVVRDIVELLAESCLLEEVRDAS